jgi:hypothetical protein
MLPGFEALKITEVVPAGGTVTVSLATGLSTTFSAAPSPLDQPVVYILWPCKWKVCAVGANPSRAEKITQQFIQRIVKKIQLLTFVLQD